jgi:hypothetical protein
MVTIFFSKPDKAWTLFFGIVLGLIIFCFAALFSRLNVDVHHQGIMFAAAMRILNGDSLYIGNSYYYGPIVPILNACALYFFGKHLLVLQLMASACYGFIAILLWRIWGRFLPGWLSGATVIFSFLLAPFLYWEFHPWSSVYSLLFLLLSLYFTIKWIETKSDGLLNLVGIFVALAFWSRQTVGLPLALTLLLVVIFLCASLREEKNTRIKPILFYLSGFIPILFIGIAILFLHNSLNSWFISCFSSRLDWAINMSGEGSGLHQIFRTVILCLFDFFKLSYWMLLPVAMLFMIVDIIIKVLRKQKGIQTEHAIYIAYIAACFVSWLQYYPVTDPRHHFWSALPLCAIPIIFLWRIYGQKLSPVYSISLLTSSKTVKRLWWGISGLVLIFFSITYYIEVKQRLFSGIQIDSSLRLIPAWKRLSLYNTPFLNPPVLQGMLGTKSQVESLSRLYDGIRRHSINRRAQCLENNSSWDFLATYYLECKPEVATPPRLLLSDAAVAPQGYKLLIHETVIPSFAYQLKEPGEYYLYSIIE